MTALRIVTAVLLLAAPLSAAWEGNQCVQCHEAEKLPISLGHSFEEWRASNHARAGVGCEKCHGGDASATDENEAHRNVEPALNPQSLVHVSRLVKTCGACHAKERAAYEQTVHARQVAERNAGATCSTCHGSMATSLPSPADLRSRCAVCHDKPVLAQEALSVLAAAKLQLYRTRRAMEAVGSAKDADWYSGALERFHGMERTYNDISLRWHTFAMKGVLKSSRDLLKLAKLLDEEVRLRNRMDRE
jgi:hypothetical protein